MQKKPYSLRDITRKFLPFFRPYFKKYAGAMLLLVATSLLGLVPPLIFKQMIDNGIKVGNVRTITLMAFLLFLVALLSQVTRWCMEYIHEWVSARFVADIRDYLFTHILSQSMAFFGSAKLGDILGRLRNDITAVYGVLVNTFLGSLSEVVQVVGVTAILFYLNRPLALVAISFTPPLFLAFVYFGRILRKLSRVSRDRDVAMLEFFQERLGNIHLVKLYDRQSHEQATHRKLSAALIQAILKSVRYRFVSVSLVGLFTSGAAILVAWYGGMKVVQAGMSFGTFFAFYLYTARLYAPVQSLANRGVEIYSGLASAERIMEYLDLKPSIAESADAARPEHVQGEITFHDVGFSYPGSDRPAVSGVSFLVEPMRKVALVGSSGAGKTTLIHLLSRLYEVNTGSITIDGYDIRDLSFESLYSSIAVVPQDVFLFNSTIEENIRYGRLDATQEEIIAAAKKAYLHDFITALPDGYQTVIGPRGVKLSGGQRQRLAICRLVLKDAPIWVLDEFTSSLDSRSEAILYENLVPLLRNKTALIIAHRLSTILSADQIIVMDEGEIAEIGTHQELYELNGIYRHLFDKQLQAGRKFSIPENGRKVGA